MKLATDAEVDRIGKAVALLAEPALQFLQTRRPDPLSQYLSIAAEAAEVDVEDERAAGFQRRFNGLYGVRRNAEWRRHFYAEFQTMKRAATPQEAFSGMLQGIGARTGRTEASFVSKAVASVHSEGPIIDSIVRTRLEQLVAAPRFGGGEEEARAYYGWLIDLVTRLGQTGEAQGWARRFDAQFSSVRGAASLHIHRKLDFLLWAARDVIL